MTTRRMDTTNTGPAPQAPPTERIRAAWDALAEGYDRFTTPMNLALAERALQHVELAPGTRLLDVASGAGALALPAARAGADVLATDLAPEMVERLARRARAEGLANLDARVMDGMALALEDETVDVAASQFGVMLFPDLAGGLREMVRVTRPGGQVLMVTFGPLERVAFLGVFVGALRASVAGFEGPPLDPPPLPFQVGDPARLQAVMEEAGLQEVRVEVLEHTMRFASGAEMWDAIVHSNPIGAAMVTGLSEGQRRGAEAELDAALARNGNVIANQVNVAVGRVP